MGLLLSFADKVANENFGSKLVLSAASSGHQDVVRLLLGAGSDTDGTDMYGSTALHLAVKDGHVEVVQLLLEAGEKKDVTNQYGKTACAWQQRMNIWKWCSCC